MAERTKIEGRCWRKGDEGQWLVDNLLNKLLWWMVGGSSWKEDKGSREQRVSGERLI